MEKMKIEKGQKHNRWQVIGQKMMLDGRAYFRCKCECGTVKSVYMQDLRTGKSKSCGCLQVEATKARFAKNSTSPVTAYKVVQRG